MNGFQQVVADLRQVFACFPLASLLHVRANRHRLIRWNYTTPDGKGCLMNLLSEPLPQAQRIYSKDSLMRFFCADWQPGRDCSGNLEYQPAKWIVRLWDGHICDQLRARYAGHTHLTEDELFAVLDMVIAERTALENEARLVEERVAARLEEKQLVA